MNTSLTFEPKKWHYCSEDEKEYCINGVNCYSYVLNNPNYFWSVPGLGFIQVSWNVFATSFNNYFKKVSLKDFRKTLIDGAIADGLIKIGQPINTPNYYLAALFFPKKEKDFHWYRQDNETWSHKDGSQPAVNKNENGELIFDPKKDAKKNYPIFGGYFLVPIKGIKLTKKF